MRSKRALNNIISSVFLQISTIICGFIITKLIISTYGSKVNGLISSIVQFLGFITLIEAGFGQVIKSNLFKPIANKDKEKIELILSESEKFYRRIAVVFALYILGLCIVLPVFFYKDFNSLYIISLVIIISFSSIVEYIFGLTYKIFLQAEQNIYILSILNIVIQVVNTIIIFALIKCGAGIHIVKAITLFIYLIRPIFLNFYVKKVYKINTKNVVGDYKIKQKWDGLVQHIAYVVHTDTDIAILSLAGDLTEVSVYSIYLMIVNKLKNIVQSFAGGIDSAFGDMIAKNENDILNKNFKIYEAFYFTIVTIVFSSTLFLIVPFIKIYTRTITDVNYLRPNFAIIIIVAELISVVRQPYNELVKVSGHFKETRFGSFLEAFSNITISIILVWKFGIVGVAIGTLVAMIIRAFDLVWYASKYILERSRLIAIKNFFAIVVEIVLITVIMKNISKVEVESYSTWFIQAVKVFLISSIVVFFINSFVYKSSYRNIFMKLTEKFKKKQV